MKGGRLVRGPLFAGVIAAMLGVAFAVAPPASPTTVLLLLAVGIVAGVFGGLIGVGGIKLVEGYVAVGAGLILAAGSIAGARVGAAAVGRFRPATLKLVFGLYFLYAATRFVAGFSGIGVP